MNIGHFLDHFFILTSIKYFFLIFFGLFSLPSGWLADMEGMIVFFVGIGDPLYSDIFAVGIFASIYHPVGLAFKLPLLMVYEFITGLMIDYLGGVLRSGKLISISLIKKEYSC